ncbi:MAG: OmpA family protein [Flavobacteriales bacterium]|nr:OmpA family protein [Flavobacteriales bacterium]
MHRIFLGLGFALLASLPLAKAQSMLQRTLSADTMPNLVPNPGFETTQRLYCRWTTEARKFNENLIDWNSPTETTPDHFSTENDPECWSHPGKRTNGKASPHGGSAMVGIKTWGKGNTPSYWHEYLQCVLPEPLEQGRRYIAEMWVRRAEFSNEASNNIGMWFTDKPISTRDRLPLYFTPYVNEADIVKKRGWHKVSGVFDATGSERYLLIGNFYGDEHTSHERMPDGERGAYYFIDDVNVRIAPEGTALTPKPMESIPPPPKVIVPDHASTAEVDLYTVEPEIGKSIRLDNIQFDFDKAILKKESEEELGRIVDLMTDYPFMRIKISAHTDDQGSDEYNRKLSEARAKAVVDHLVEHKVEAERLTWSGSGETAPLADNSTEAGRALNRRVEFTVLER